MKNSGVEWIGEIPEDWEVSKTKYLADLYTGNSIKDEEKSLYEDKLDAISYISSKDIDALFSTADYENGMYIKQTDNHFVRAPANSTLMCIEGGSAGKKKTFLIQDVCFVNKLCCFYPKKINAKFLFYCLNSPNYEDQFRLNISGMIGGVSIGKLNQFYLTLPSEFTQQRIVSYLDKKCSKIEETIQNQQQVIEKLKAYKQSLITEAVTGKVKIVNGKACGEYESYKDSGVEWIGKIPSGWKKCKFTRIIIDTRNGLSRRDLNKSTGNLVLKLKNINPDGNIDLTETNRIELSKNEIQNYQLQNDDFLFVRVNGSKSLVGKCAIYKTIENIVAYNDHIIRVRFNLNLCNVYYIKYLLQSSYAKYDIANHIKTAAGQFTISSEDLCNLICLLPSIDEQKSIADYLNKKCLAIDNAIEQKQKLIEKLAEYKKSLIYECVTGKKEC